MKRVVFGLLGVIVLAIVAVVAVAMLTPKDVYKERIESAAAKALGRDVALNGDVGLGFFPRISASVEDVLITNPEGFTADHLVRAGALRASVKWAPLFTGRVEVFEIAFVDADVQLEKLADGRTNWEFGTEEVPGEPTPEKDPQSTEINAGVDRARLQNASLTYIDRSTDQTYAFTDLNMEASVASLTEKLIASGSGVYDTDAFAFDLSLDSPQALLDGQLAALTLTFDTDIADFTFGGDATLGDIPVLAGTFTVNAPDLAALAANAEIDPATLPVRLGPLGGMTASGTLSGPLETMAINFERLNLKGDGLNVDYRGGVTLAETPTLDGALTLDIVDTGRLINALGLDIAQAGALAGASLDLTTTLSGKADAINASATSLTLAGPLLEAGFKGTVSTAGAGNVNGALNASSADLRGLLAAAAIELAPGETLRTFKVSGDAAGAFNRLAIANLNFGLDDITGKGNLTLRTDTPRPSLNGTLTTGPLDLTAFIGEPPANQPKGWSKEPLALESLSALDANLTLSSPEITIDKIKLRDASLTAFLENGVLNATVNQFKAFGGSWKGDIGLNARAATPTVSMAFSGNSILMEDIMKTFVGSDRLTGGGQFALNVEGQGASLDAIMNSLNGALTANLADGALKGINVGQLIRTTTDLRSSLSAGSFNLGLSPSSATDFTNFNSVLEIRDGVAQIKLMEMISSSFGANGSGQIDLGGQTLDMLLAIAADKAGQGNLANVQVNNIGIPLKITGDWTSPSIRPDISALQQLLAGKAIDRVGNLIGGDAGSLINGALGNRDGQTATPRETIEGAARERLGNALGGVLGNGGQQTPTPTEGETPAGDAAEQPAEAQPEEQKELTPEERAREALGGLLRPKKKEE